MTLTLVASLASLAAAAETADEIIAKNLAARGGVEKIKAVKSMRMTGKMTAGPQEFPFVMTNKRPNRQRIEFTVQGLTGVRAYDGTQGWALMPFFGKKDPEAVPDEENKMMAEGADIDGALVDYKAKGHTVELIGKEKYEGTDAYKLKITLKSGEVRYYYIDAESFLEIASEGKRKMRGSEAEFVTTIGDYKDVNGLMVPYSIETGVKAAAGTPAAAMKQVMTVEKVEIDVDLPDSLFALPAGTKPAAKPEPAQMAKTPPAGDASAKTEEKKTDETAKAAEAKSTDAAKSAEATDATAQPAKTTDKPAKKKKP
jgi:hypothetical protein